MAPVEVNVENKGQVWQPLFSFVKSDTQRNFYKEGDRIKITQARKKVQNLREP